MREFAASIVETVRHPLLVLDSSLRVCSANSAFQSMFTVRGEQVSGHPVIAPGGPLDIPELRDRLAQLADGGDGFNGFEVTHHFSSTGPKTLLLNARRVLNEDDRSPMILLAIEDVTDAKRAEDALKGLNEELESRVRQRTAQLEAANKEMEAFCYSVSHDLRAPLRAIDGFAQELLNGYGETLDGTARHYLARMRANSQRMAELIDDLLLLSRLSRAEMTVRPVDLTALAEEVAAELRQGEPDRELVFSAQQGMTASGDARLLRVVFENILRNAWKFTSKKPQAIVEIGRTESDRRAAFFVRDDGAGFDMRYVGNLFGAFQRLHHEKDFPGTGIGLAIVQRIVHRHGGRVWAEGEVGRGATFYFTLPGEGMA